MDQAALVELQIEEGKRLIHHLLEEGIGVAGAAWLKEADSGMWHLYIATPAVSEEGATLPAYHRVNAVKRKMAPPLGLGLSDVKVISPSDAIAKAIREVNNRHPGRLAACYPGTSIGGLSIDGSYVYPLPAAVAG